MADLLPSSYLAVGIGSCNCASCMAKRRQHALQPGVVAARAKAGRLLHQFLIEPQWEDWQKHQAINVRSDLGRLWRITPRRSGRADALVRDDGYGACVWPVRLEIAADIALAMLLNLRYDEMRVLDSGCQEWFRRPDKPVGGAYHYLTPGIDCWPHDYEGAI